MFALKHLALSSVRRSSTVRATVLNSSPFVPRQQIATIATPECLALPNNGGAVYNGQLTGLFQTLRSLFDDGIMLISTLKRRRKMMNKHKLRKRRKKNRMKTRK